MRNISVRGPIHVSNAQCFSGVRVGARSKACRSTAFQALSIPTKISRGTIEIVSDVALIAVGDKVGASESTLLNLLNISPFSYGLVVENVYDDGSVFSPKVLDITDEDLKSTFMAGVANIAAVSFSELPLTHFTSR